MLNAERFKEEINKYNNEFGLADNIVDCGTLGRRNCRFSRSNNSDGVIIMCSTRKVKWLLSEYREPVKLTRFEQYILKYILEKTQYRFIVREKSDNIYIYKRKPKKGIGAWDSSTGMLNLNIFINLFPFIKWEDEEPTPIKEVLENCEVVDDD